MQDHSLKLTYFDFHGGRGEVARLAMHLGNIPFEDDRVVFDKWPGLKPSTPFGGIPILEVDGKRLTQSNSINRFVGKLARLYPADPWQAALCDEVMDAVEDAGNALVATFGIKDQAELEAKRKQLAEGTFTRYLKQLDTMLEARGGQYFADNRLTVADLKVFVWVRHLGSGRIDHLPTDLVDRVAPLVAAHRERIRTNPQIMAYYEARGGY